MFSLLLDTRSRVTIESTITPYTITGYIHRAITSDAVLLVVVDLLVANMGNRRHFVKTNHAKTTPKQLHAFVHWNIGVAFPTYIRNATHCSQKSFDNMAD